MSFAEKMQLARLRLQLLAEQLATALLPYSQWEKKRGYRGSKKRILIL